MRRMIFFLLAGLLLLGLAVPAFAWLSPFDSQTSPQTSPPLLGVYWGLSGRESGQDVELIGQVSGYMGAVAVSGAYAYIGEGPRLTVLDISVEPDNPSFVGQTAPLADVVLDVFVVGSYAYLALGEDGLAVIDVSTPANPTLAGSYQMPGGWANRLEVSGSYAYVADSSSAAKLRVIDVSDAANPTQVAAVEMASAVLNVTLSGNYAYVAMADNGQQTGDGGLRIVDISSPESPQEVGIYETTHNSVEVAVAGNYAYLAASDDGLLVIDVSNPTSPSRVDHVDQEWAAIGVLVVNTYAYVVSNYGALEIFDIANPSALSYVNSFSMAVPSNIAFANNYIYAAAGVLWMIDVSQPQSLPAATFYGTSGYVKDVAIAGDVAYLAIGEAWNGLQVIDISNKASPIHLGMYNDEKSYYPVFGIDVAGNYAYLAKGGDGLKVIDVSEPNDPFLAGSVDTPGDAQDVVVAGTYAYVADGFNHGLRVIDISTHPTEVGFLQTDGYALGVDVAGNYAYLADGGVSNSVRVIDVSDPSTPTQVGAFNMMGAERIIVEGNYAYVAVGDGGLWVLDVSDPTNPTLAGTSQAPALAHDVTVVGNVAYVADDLHGLRVLDIKRLLDIDALAVYESPGLAVGVKEADGYVYLASGTGGLNILQYAGAVPPTSTPTNTPPATATPSGSATPTPTPGENGPYEPNETCVRKATIETNGTVQAHTFYNANDADWVAFEGIAGTEYLVEARTPTDSVADVALEVYNACDDGSFGGQGNTFSPDVRLQFEALETGTYYLRLTNQVNTGGADAVYHLSVRALSDEATGGALILVAGRLRANDGLQDNIHNVTNAVYSLFLRNGYDSEHIHYLATDPTLDPDDDGTPDVDGLPNQQNLELAITQWAQDKVGADRALTIYMISHGGIESVYLNGANEFITPAQLDGWLEELESQVGNLPINVIIETCHGGSFIDPTASISEPSRVVISSTGVFPLAYASQNGAVFSDALIEALGQRMSLGNAFEAARGVAETAHPDQSPWLDDNGDGIPNGSADGTQAQQRGFAFAGTLSEEQWAPYIVNAEVLNIKDGEGVISAEVRDDQSITSVWAVIYKPSYQPPSSDSEELVEVDETLRTVTLLDPDGNGIYSAISSEFDELGTYRIVVYATDNQELQGEPKEIRVGSELYLPTILR